uniref:Reverse transcriptase Ty1/copia-type domain-containing protein n=1 Tax=Peronospora matthiolae TaxID=2874970 RepID=A0AAV1UBZ0_9STRA
MTKELTASESNGVWTVMVPPKNLHVLHNKWAFKTKTDADEIVEWNKDILVLCGNEQLLGIELTLNFAAVTELDTVKVILVLSSRWNLLSRHGRFLNAYVKEKKEKDLNIYMKVPSGMHGVEASWTFLESTFTLEVG